MALSRAKPFARVFARPMKTPALHARYDIPDSINVALKIERLRVHFLLTFAFSSLNNVLISFCVIFLAYMCCP